GVRWGGGRALSYSSVRAYLAACGRSCCDIAGPNGIGGKGVIRYSTFCRQLVADGAGLKEIVGVQLLRCDLLETRRVRLVARAVQCGEPEVGSLVDRKIRDGQGALCAQGSHHLPRITAGC